MNIEYARSLRMPKILDKIGLQPKDKETNMLLYPSPFSPDKPLTLKVNQRTNTWYEKALKIGGDTPAFVHEYLKYHDDRCAEVDVLDWLRINIGYPSLLTGIRLPDYEGSDGQFVFKKDFSIKKPVLIRYLDKRYVPLKIAKEYLREVHCINTVDRKKFVALGLKTEANGYAIRNDNTKAVIGEHLVSLIRGSKKQDMKPNEPLTLHVFTDAFDFISAAIRLGKDASFKDDAIILNSYSCLDNCAGLIRGKGYDRVCTWLDNGSVGQRVTRNFTLLCRMEEKKIRHFTMNHIYEGFHDVNAWHIDQSKKGE